MSNNNNTNEDGTAKGEASETNIEAEACPRLKCQLQTEGDDSDLEGGKNDNRTIETTYLLQEKGKKSSFLLQSTTSSSSISSSSSKGGSVDFHSIPTPAVIVIENGTTNPIRSPFFLGGFQLVSTAKAVEIRLTDTEGNEAFLMTSKGIPFMKDDTSAKWYKVICVVPGGPRPISKLRIILTNPLPVDTTTTVKVHSLKLTARMVESQSPTNASVSSSTMSVTSTVVTSDTGGGRGLGPLPLSQQGPSSSPPIPGQKKKPTMSNDTAPITQSDLGAAMAGMTFIARSTEKAIDGTIRQQTKHLEQHIGTYFLRLEQQVCSLQSILLTQQQLLQQNHHIIQQQQQRIEDQNMQLSELMKEQKDLRVRVQALQGDVSILRWREPDIIDDDDVEDNNLHQDESDDGAEIYEKNNSIGTDDDDVDVDDDTINKSIPGVVIPLQEVYEDEESSPDAIAHKEGVTDEVCPLDIQPQSNHVEKDISNDDVGTVTEDEITGSNDLLATSTPTQEQDIRPTEKVVVVTPNSRSKEVPIVVPSPQKDMLHKHEDDTDECDFDANIEVSLLKGESPAKTAEDGNDGDGEKARTYIADKSKDGLGHDDNDDDTHEMKVDDTRIDRARENFYDSFGIQSQQQHRLRFDIPPVNWTSPFQCLPSTAEDATM